MSARNIDLYESVIEAKRKKEAVSEGTFKHINNQRLANRTKGQTKTIMTLMDNKTWIRVNMYTHWNCDNTILEISEDERNSHNLLQRKTADEGIDEVWQVEDKGQTRIRDFLRFPYYSCLLLNAKM